MTGPVIKYSAQIGSDNMTDATRAICNQFPASLGLFDPMAWEHMEFKTYAGPHPMTPRMLEYDWATVCVCVCVCDDRVWSRSIEIYVREAPFNDCVPRWPRTAVSVLVMRLRHNVAKTTGYDSLSNLLNSSLYDIEPSKLCRRVHFNKMNKIMKLSEKNSKWFDSSRFFFSSIPV